MTREAIAEATVETIRMTHESKPVFKTFLYAFRGIAAMLRTERNARVHAAATIAALVLGFVFEIGRVEWMAIALAIMAVWCAEALNTAFEALCDVASPDYHPKVERAKDVAAGAVLIAALGALVIGVLVFGNRLVDIAVSSLR